MGPRGGDENPGQAGGPGGSGRGRWIALAAGFVVLVAVIAVQHFASGGHSPSSDSSGPSRDTGPSSVTSAGPSPSLLPSASRLPAVTGSAPRTPPSTSPTTGDTPPAPHSTAALQAGPPRTTSVRPHLLPGADHWDIVGFGPFGLMRYRPATGSLTITPVPTTPGSDVSASFVATSRDTVIRPQSSGSGYLVRPGHPADTLPGRLADAAQIMPGPDPRHLWITDRAATNSGIATGNNTLVLVDLRGEPTGSTVTVSEALGSGGYSYQPDQAGGVLVTGIGGTYDAGPDGLHLVTHGLVLAAGPTRFLVYECSRTAQCSTRAIDRTTGRRSTLARVHIGNPNLAGGGLISPDGRVAAVVEGTANSFGSVTSHLHLIDLHSGADHALDLSVNDNGPARQTLAFSPDSRYLLMATASGQIVAVTLDTGTVIRLPPPIPPVFVLATTPVG